ncbi:hypothetical protein TD95_003057 [Thielaviopsis punctulata]|uniref:PPM-type phosphatase domain-containing protein n=1 Tax=Thielaviopsis punctulata TaxID=72032 RepID=A0A0F4ZJP8_9PEZI|nr:hypothetical protein TD95_003057 [Thielaviopsis punctulata]
MARSQLIAAAAASGATASRCASGSASSSRRVLHSAVSSRRIAVVLTSLLAGYGAYQSYQFGDVGQLRSLTSLAKQGGIGLGMGFGLTASTTTTTTANAAPTRQILVIGADDLSTGTFVGEGPISKMTSDNTRAVIEMLTPEQTDEKLRKMQESYYVNRGEGVVRYDLVQMPSNNPIEDDHSEKIVHVPGKSAESSTPKSDWMFWGSLIATVARELNATYSASPDFSPAPEDIDQAIKNGFLRLDDEIVNKSVEKVLDQTSKTVAAEVLAPALSGSCALLSFYDSRSNLLRVACTGDSRAVLGRRNSKGLWSATALSSDQTGSNPDEEARLRRLHPNEPRVIHAGRVLGGLEPTRAFGDASYKWTADTIRRLKTKFFARSASPLSRTPPYVTAEPVVTTTKIQPEKGDFMVMATDGLWEMLTNEEVVGLVGKWIDANGPPAPGAATASGKSLWKIAFGGAETKLPLDTSAAASAADGSKTPIRMAQWGMDPNHARFVVVDNNVATHLLRNALGGRNADQVSALLTLPAPFSRRYRDDLTIQVVFFGESPSGKNHSGGVVLNYDASNMQLTEAPKPKL